MARSAENSWIVFRPLISSMVTLAMDMELWMRRVLEGMSPHSGAVPHSEVNNGRGYPG
jgi:hypothetical protein